MNDLLEALEPIVKAVRVHDSDTLSSMDPDETPIFRYSGSWDAGGVVTLGDFRRIREAVKRLEAK